MTEPEMFTWEGVEYLFGLANVARFLNVPEKQAYTWYDRRHRNAFPIGKVVHQGGKKRRLFTCDEIAEWHRTYVPSMGGPTSHGPGCRCRVHSNVVQLRLW